MSGPRTPEQFPRMKVRGGRRRLNARIEQAWRGTDEPLVKVLELSQTFERVQASMRVFAEAMNRMARQITIAISVNSWLARRHARDQWLSRRMLPATPSPWAAPIRKAAK